MKHPVFCVQCSSNCCTHLQESRQNLLSPREVGIIRALCDPRIEGHKAVAFSLGLQEATIKFYLNHVYAKLGWKTGSSLRLVLWAMAHREELGIPIPEKAAFARDAREVAA